MQRAATAAGFVATALLAGAAAAQQAATEDAARRSALVVRIGVDVVQLDAIVTDGQGRHVIDLKAEDFELRQDGVAQVITNCQYVRVDAPDGQPPSIASGSAPRDHAELPRREEIRRTIVLVVGRADIADVPNIRDAVRAFVEQELRPDDLVAIVSVFGAGIRQHYTTDKRVLLAAADAIRPRHVQRPRQALPAETLATLRSAAVVEPEEELQEEERLTMAGLGQLADILADMKGLPGRKSLVFFNGGVAIPMAPPPDRTRGVAPGSAMGPPPLGSTGPDVTALVRRIAELANRASVVLYSADVRGIPVLGFQAGDGGARTDGGVGEGLSRIAQGPGIAVSRMIPRDLAAATGGFSFSHNDLAGGLREAMEDQRAYYLIGYAPPPDGFQPDRRGAKFHRIELRVRREGLRVRTRHGFFGTPDRESRPRDGGDPLAAALVSPFAAGELGTRLVATFAYDAERRPLVRTLVHVDGGRLTFSRDPDGALRTRIDLLAVAFDEKSAPVRHLGRPLSVRVPEQALTRLERSGLFLDFSLPVEWAGAYQVRVAVRDVASGRVDKAFGFTNVPEIGRGVTLSGLLVATWPELVGDEAVREASGRLMPDAGASPALREFHAGDELFYSVTAYAPPGGRESPPRRLQGRVRLWRRSGEVVHEQPMGWEAPASVSGGLEARGRFSLSEDLPAGTYSLEVVIDDPTGKGPPATQTTDFEVKSTG